MSRAHNPDRTPTPWSQIKAMAEMAQAFPILDPVFELHHLSATFDGCCNHCISSDASHDVPWPCPTIRVVLSAGGYL